MLRQIFIGSVMLCVFGCQRHPQNTADQDKPINPTLSMNNESQIKLVVCGYLIEKEIKPLSGDLLFVAVDTNELQKIAQKFPTYQLKTGSEAEFTERHIFQDRSTKQRGVVIEIKSINISNQNASAYAGYFTGAGVTFTFDLKKDNAWRILKVSKPIIANPM